MPVMVQARFLIFVVILKEHVLIKKNLFEVKQSELTAKWLNIATQIFRSMLTKKTSQKRPRLVVEAQAQQMTISISGSFNKPVQISEKNEHSDY